jgi:cell division protein FtsI (penicillin-binding protein 3)
METNWLKIQKKDNALSLFPVINVAKQMPDVKGMSAKDATYLLESKGLKVSINGFGRVKQQSLKAGSILNKGSKVNLILG